MHRRAFLCAAWGAALALAHERALADAPSAPQDLDVRDLSAPDGHGFSGRFTLATPKHLRKDERVPLVVLLHGLGETGDERAGAFAWLERYGLGSADDRLRRPPIARTTSLPYWTSAHLAEVNAALAAEPFRGLAFACPYTPNVAKAKSPEAALDRYAAWITDTLVPRVRAIAPVFPDAARTSIDGCSLGGYVGLEVFLRRPEAFAAWGGVQAAVGAHRASSYAERLAAMIQRTGARRIHIETSSGDPFHDANVALADALSRHGIARDLSVLPGPHDQPWLREIGTIEMLAWHDRLPR
jgi:hypothetical protein